MLFFGVWNLLDFILGLQVVASKVRFRSLLFAIMRSGF